VVGNVKESLIPYATKQWKLAKLSFDLFGALEKEKKEGEDEAVDKNQEGKSNERPISQPQVEAKLIPVITCLLFLASPLY